MPQGILHRDIKPSEPAARRPGHVVDHGFRARPVRGAGGHYSIRRIASAPFATWPRRLEGKGDARSDIYALGITLYEMLTLSQPFTGSDRIGLIEPDRQRNTPAPPSRCYASPFPADQGQTIVLKALSRDPPHAMPPQDMAEDLRCFLENRPIQARRSSVVDARSLVPSQSSTGFAHQRRVLAAPSVWPSARPRPHSAERGA